MKRGQAEVLQTTMIFEMIVGLLVAGILFWALFSFGELSMVNKNYVEKDLKQVVEFVESMPGDVEVDYPVSGISYDGENLFEDEFCELKIIKEGKDVSYRC